MGTNAGARDAARFVRNKSRSGTHAVEKVVSRSSLPTSTVNCSSPLRPALGYNQRACCR
jgi:hypothetical protein